MTISDAMLKEWAFLNECEMVTNGNATHFDAEHMLEMFANILAMRMQHGGDAVNGVLIWLEGDNVLDETIWWSSETQLFYLGLLGDTEGSLTT